jgi:hypothetical protein
MSQQYLLPCECGAKVRVDAAQAGGTVPCGCGRKLYVPTFRGLKQLELAPPDKALERRAPERNWSQLNGAIFTSGLLAAIAAGVLLALAVMQYVQVAEFTQDRTSLVVEHDAQYIDRMAADETIEVFRDWQAEGLGQQEAPPWVHAQRVASSLKQRIIVLGIVAIFGIIAAIGAVMFRPGAKAAAA